MVFSEAPSFDEKDMSKKIPSTDELIGSGGPNMSDFPEYNQPQDVINAFNNGNLGKDQAEALIGDMFRKNEEFAHDGTHEDWIDLLNDMR